MSTPPNPYEPPQGNPWHAGATRPVGRIYDDYPVAVFETVVTEGWFLQCLKQANRLILSNPFHQENIAWWLGRVFLAILILGASWLFITDPHSRLIVGGAAIIGAMIGVAVGIIRWRRHFMTMAQFRRLPIFNTTVKVTLYREGLAMEGIITTMTKRWRGFLMAGRFPDGISLIDDKNQRHWLPFADLVQGNAADAEQLVGQSVAGFQVINKI